MMWAVWITELDGSAKPYARRENEQLAYNALSFILDQIQSQGGMVRHIGDSRYRAVLPYNGHCAELYIDRA